MVPCHEEIYSWTFPALVGAFVDLAVAYLLLLAAVTTFLSSRFLSLLGLRLPCTCSHPASEGWCLRSLLSQDPHARIACVHSTLAARPPFRGCLGAQADCLKIGFCEGGCRAFGPATAESCGSVKRDLLLTGRGGGEDGGGSSSGSEGAWLGSRVSRKGARRRRRAVLADVRSLRRTLDFSGTPLLGWQEGSGRDVSSPHSDGGISSQRGVPDQSPSPVYFTGNCSLQGHGDIYGSSNLPLVEKDKPDGLDGDDSESRAIKKDISKDPCRTSEETIKILEKALEQEQSARIALYLELEKERSASASAADEAMAMIERLQNEKAHIDMNAKQYERMIEEKAAYDEEEMELLKEIIVRRERELFVMSKEVEMYRLMVVSGEVRLEEFDGYPETVELDVQEPSTSKEYRHNQMPSAVQSSKVTEKVKNDHKARSNDPAVVDTKSSSYIHDQMLHSHYFAEGSLLQVSQDIGDSTKHGSHPEVIGRDGFDDDHQEFQEKGIVSVGVYKPPIPIQNPKKIDASSSYAEDGNCDRDFVRETILAAETTDKYNTTEHSSHVGLFEKNDKKQSISFAKVEPSVFDVHVIDDRSTFSRGDNHKGTVPCTDVDSVDSQDHPFSLKPDEVRNIEILNDDLKRGWTSDEPDVERSSSDGSRTTRLSRSTLPSELRRSSMSAVDDERIKLEIEVEDLRRRLEIVQQGRKKLNFSVDSMEKENFHLELLNEIALQLQAIKQLTNPDKAIRQTSLPPPSSKITTKKKRCRSVSCGLQESG